MEPAPSQRLAVIGRRGDLITASRVGSVPAARAGGGLLACPTCQRPWPVVDGRPSLTPRELDVLSAWWHYRSVQLAAKLIGVGEQRAKNLLARARQRSGVQTNEELVVEHLASIRSVRELVSHNVRRAEAE